MSQRFGSWELRLTEEGDLNENVDDDESSQGDIVALTFCILQFIYPISILLPNRYNQLRTGIFSSITKKIFRYFRCIAFCCSEKKIEEFAICI